MTARLRIEPLAPTHAAALFEDLRDPALYEFIPDEPPPTPGALLQRFAHLAAGPGPERRAGGEVWRNWVMVDRADERPVGTLQATLYGQRAVIAYAVVRRRWREGFATEGVTWLCGALAAAGVVRAEAFIDTRNTASIELVERLGFLRTRTIVGAAHFKGHDSDEHVYVKQPLTGS